MTEQTLPDTRKKRGPAVEYTIEPPDNWPADLKAKMDLRVQKQGVEVVQTYRSTTPTTTVYHVVVKDSEGNLTHWRSSRAPEWYGWVVSPT